MSFSRKVSLIACVLLGTLIAQVYIKTSARAAAPQKCTPNCTKISCYHQTDPQYFTVGGLISWTCDTPGMGGCNVCAFCGIYNVNTLEIVLAGDCFDGGASCGGHGVLFPGVLGGQNLPPGTYGGACYLYNMSCANLGSATCIDSAYSPTWTVN